QGERELAADCRSLAKFILRGIPPMPAGIARLEITFPVDAGGLLSVTAQELTTGGEQEVEGQAGYRPPAEEGGKKVLAALRHGEEDLEERRLIEERVEAERVLLATRKALAADADLLEPGERESIDTAIRELEEAKLGQRAAHIHAKTEALDDATHAWAGRRMD